MSNISERLANEVEKSGLTYREIQEKTGIHISALNRYITGQTSKIPISKIEKIADALNISAAYLMCWTDDPHFALEEDKESPPVETDELKILIDSLSEDKKQQLEQLTEEEEKLSKIIAEESYEKPTFTKEQLVKWMSGFKTGDKNSPKFRKQIIDIFVNAIYLYDDHFTISYHTGERQDVMSYSSAIEADSLVPVSCK